VNDVYDLFVAFVVTVSVMAAACAFWDLVVGWITDGSDHGEPSR
jgi:predicted benzoate:H+ symporter BenE